MYSFYHLRRFEAAPANGIVKVINMQEVVVGGKGLIEGNFFFQGKSPGEIGAYECFDIVLTAGVGILIEEADMVRIGASGG